MKDKNDFSQGPVWKRIVAQGFPRIGMLSTVIGATVNIVLGPIFIFTFDMGVAGAALATIISQSISVVWVLNFLFSKKAINFLFIITESNHCGAIDTDFADVWIWCKRCFHGGTDIECDWRFGMLSDDAHDCL